MYVGSSDSGRPAALNRRLNHLLIRLAIRANILLLQGHYWQGVKMQTHVIFLNSHFWLHPHSHSIYTHMVMICCTVLEQVDKQWRCTKNPSEQGQEARPSPSIQIWISSCQQIYTLHCQHTQQTVKKLNQEAMLPSGGLEERDKQHKYILFSLAFIGLMQKLFFILSTELF